MFKVQHLLLTSYEAPPNANVVLNYLRAVLDTSRIINRLFSISIEALILIKS